MSSDAVAMFCTEFNLVIYLGGIIGVLQLLKGTVLHEFHVKLSFKFQIWRWIVGFLFNISSLSPEF